VKCDLSYPKPGMVHRNLVVECAEDGVLFEASDVMKQPHGFCQYHFLIRHVQCLAKHDHILAHAFCMLFFETDVTIDGGIVCVKA